jgi:ketosteroid isomerase-like protein
MSENNVQMARRGFDAMLCGDLKVIAEMLDPDVKWHGGDPSVGCQNRAEALEFMRQALERRGPEIELIDIVEAGDKVVVIMRPQEPDDPGDEPASPVANVSTFRDGKVVEMVAYPDPDEALAAARDQPSA